MKKKKCYVLTVSKNFPSYHRRKGEPTEFVDKILNGKKIHTIRSNYELWSKRIDEVNKGKAYISLRYWSGKPRKSKQLEFMRLEKAGYQSIEWDVNVRVLINEIDWYPYYTDGYNRNIDPIHELSYNDGLSYRDFYNWFKLNRLKVKPFSGIIIHFTDFRY